MKKETKIFLLYKITARKYLKSLADGVVHFSCCAKYVDIAKNEGKIGEGDKYECVFAKYLIENSSEPKKRYQRLFGRDLLLEKENGYVLFRRKSSLLIPTACFYSIDNETAIANLNDEDRIRIEAKLEENKGKIAYFGGINKCKFKGKIVPGDKVRLETKIIRRKGPVGVGEAVASVDGKVVVSAELTFMVG